VRRSPIKAKELFAKGLETMIERSKSNNIGIAGVACMYLANAYKIGWGVKESKKKMIDYYKKASLLGLAEADYELFVIYRNRDLSRKHIDIAIEHLRKSVDKEYAEALCALGNLYQEGVLLSKNQKLAIDLWQRASLQGHAESLANLGYAYFRGDGLTRNLKEAKKYLVQAIQHGDNSSMYALDIIERELNEIDHMDDIRKYAKKLDFTQKSLKDEYDIIERDLKKDFDGVWDKIQPDTRLALITAVYTYINYIKLEEHQKDFDYSSVILQLSKGLETEMERYFHKEYLKYPLSNNISPHIMTGKESFVKIDRITKRKQYIENSEYYAFTLGKIQYNVGLEKRLIENTLGQKIGFVNHEDSIVIKNPSASTYSYKFNPHFLKFMESILAHDTFNKMNRNEEIMDYLVWLILDINTIVFNLRNRAAHTMIMTIDEAEVCANWILKVKRILYKFVSKINSNQ